MLKSNTAHIIFADENGSFTVIVDGFDGDAIEAAAALLYRGEINVGPGTDSGALASAFTELIVPDRKVNYFIGNLDLIIYRNHCLYLIKGIRGLGRTWWRQ